MKKIMTFLFVATLITGWVLPGAAVGEKLPRHIAFASKPMGVYYVMTAGLARVVEKQTGMKVTVETAANQYSYMPFFKTKENALAVLASIYVYQAYHGLDKFKKGGRIPLAYLGTGHIQEFMWWTTPATGIKTVKDMAGKTIATRSPASILGTSFCQESLKHSGIIDQVKQITRPSSNTETVAMLKEKKLDAMAMPPNPQLLELERSVGLVPVGPGEGAIKKLIESPYWARSQLKPGKFGVKKPIDTAAFTVGIYTYKDLPENVAYALVKAAFENLDQLRSVHRYYKRWSLKSAVEHIPVPMHPGAIKYYKDKGVWTGKQEAVQKKLLARGK